MEVHHHPQMAHKPKPWKEYLLEGLMIFIAVMMGFIAENIREGISNREQVKELVTQLVHDLKNDTSGLNGIYSAETDISNADDSLMNLLQLPLHEVKVDQLQELIVHSHSLWLFYPSRGAIAAIKNQIRLSQFSNSQMIGLIAGYEGHIDLLHTVQDITLQYQRMYIDPFLVQHFTGISLHGALNRIPGANTEVRNLSQEDLIQLSSDMALISINTRELKDNNRRLFADASNILQYVKQQYEVE
jgi:hypothetical protein